MVRALLLTFVAGTALAAFAAGPVQALAPQDDESAEARPDEDDESPAEEDEDWTEDLVTTTHAIVLDGVEVPYEATTGTMKLQEEDGKDKAAIFFVAYRRTDVEDDASRPVMFTFNGGPGSSSVWLHMGAFGPRRVPMNDDATPSPPPYALVDNAYSLLDVTDLVFIDPVTTGYSRAVPGEDDSQFHGLSEDVQAVGEFIRLWTTRFERWDSPKFLSGESYGTTRAAGLAGHLQDHHGMYLNGLVLVSSILSFATARFDPGNDLPYPLFLPTYTATAWYHDRLAPELQENLAATLDEVEAFALGDYWLALAQGDALGDAERADIAARLARYTGLSTEFVEQTNLRIVIHEFCKELLRDERRTAGRLDSRFEGVDADAAGSSYDYDPSYAAIQGPYTATLNDYVRTELGYENDIPYEILTGRVHPWNTTRGRYVNTGETLRSAMSKNPYLKVYVANGFYDLATPYFATEYTFAHLGLEPELAENVSMGYFPAGHMMYIHEPSAAELKADVATFLAETLAGN